MEAISILKPVKFCNNFEGSDHQVNIRYLFQIDFAKVWHFLTNRFLRAKKHPLR